MLLASRTHSVRRNPEGGFVLVLALIAIMILLGIGYFALTVSTSDLRIASRIVGERKAFSAAESGVHILCRTFDPATFTGLADQVIDASDPASTFDVDSPHVPTNPNIPGQLPVTGFSMSGGQEWSQKTYETIVTGNNDDYDSRAQIGVGFGYFDGGSIMYR